MMNKFHWILLTAFLVSLGSLEAPIGLLINSPIIKPEDSMASLTTNFKIFRSLVYALILALILMSLFNGFLIALFKLLILLLINFAVLSFYTLRLNYVKQFGQLSKTIKKAGIAALCLSMALYFLTK